MLILGIETSCDETGVALYDAAHGGLLAHAVHSQVAMHEAYGGVVPELASRDHLRRLVPLTRHVASLSKRGLEELGCVSYTEGPGLAGALLAGAAFAQSLACALGVRALGIHHLEGHLLSPLLSARPPGFPFVALLVSGGHTQLVRVEDVGRYAMLGETQDDAAGEAFDKTAQLLGLGYPGGPALSALAEQGRPGRCRLPRPMLERRRDAGLDFSFSGLKTAVRGVLSEGTVAPADLAREFVDAVVEVLVAKCERAIALTGLERLVVAGGVGANRQLRAALDAAARARRFDVFYPEPELCTDNGAMIALAAALRLQRGLAGAASRAFRAQPRWTLGA